MKKIYQIFLVISFVIILALSFCYNRFYFKKSTQGQNQSKVSEAIDYIEKKLEVNTEIQKTDSVEIPDSYQIENVPFVPQAPYANWDELHDEACEEASIIITEYFLKNKVLTVEKMESEIQKMVAWQEKNWGGHYDLTAKQTVELANKFYGLNFKTQKISSLSDIKKEVSKNHLVIVPTAGRMLGNPNYRSPGPVYHMLVVTGYTQNEIITQDVGTRNGENYSYANAILYNAIHDWTGSPGNIEEGEKVMIITE